MTSSQQESVVSGRPYLVVEVSGAHPIALDDFVGDVWFVAVLDVHTYRIGGAGARDGDGVRFHQKDGGRGKDLRTWHITVNNAGDFEAEALSQF